MRKMFEEQELVGPLSIVQEALLWNKYSWSLACEQLLDFWKFVRGYFYLFILFIIEILLDVFFYFGLWLTDQEVGIKLLHILTHTLYKFISNLKPILYFLFATNKN